MAAALSAHTSGQMPGCPAAMRVMSRKPPAGQPQQRGVLLGGPVGQVHERGGGEVRHVGDDRHQRVVLLGARAPPPRRRGSSTTACGRA